jgi:hypothetical protein
VVAPQGKTVTWPRAQHAGNTTGVFTQSQSRWRRRSICLLHSEPCWPARTQRTHTQISRRARSAQPIRGQFDSGSSSGHADSSSALRACSGQNAQCHEQRTTARSRARARAVLSGSSHFLAAGAAAGAAAADLGLAGGGATGAAAAKSSDACGTSWATSSRAPAAGGWFSCWAGAGGRSATSRRVTRA